MDLDPMSKKTMHDFYFNMGDAVKDFSKSEGATDKALSAAKIVGKGLFNTGLFTVLNAPEAIARMALHTADEKLKTKGLSEENRDYIKEQKAKLEATVEEKTQERNDRKIEKIKDEMKVILNLDDLGLGKYIEEKCYNADLYDLEKLLNEIKK
jgi:uncharacterized protein HemX